MTAGNPRQTDQNHEGRLRAAGLRATRPRLLVLAGLRGLGGHRSAEAIGSALAGAGTPLSRGTIYKVLDDLVAGGLAMSADSGPGTAIYEVAERWHHHFVCRRCGTVVDVDCVVGDKPCLHAELAGAVIDEAQVIFRGTCPRCAGIAAG